MTGRLSVGSLVRGTVQGLALSAAVAGFAGCSVQNLGQSSGVLATSKLNGGIIGGTEANGNEEFAKTVVMLYDKSVGALCTASIISDKLLLTAAHCVSSTPTSLFVIFGTDMNSPNADVRRVVTAETTPVWASRQNEELNNGDMAMVGFIGGLPEGYAPAKMLADVNQLKDGETVTLAGYGTSDGVAGSGAGKLRYVDTTIAKAGYTESEILMDQTKGKGACHGDSGGPAYVSVNGERLLIGVTSRGVNDPENHCGVNAAYTSIAYYSAWVQKEAVLMAADVDKVTELVKEAIAKKKAAAAAGQTPQQEPAPADAAS